MPRNGQRCKKKANLALSMKRCGVNFTNPSKNILALMETVQQEKTCLFCLTTNDNAEDFGEFIHHKRSGIWIHYFCLLLASNLEQSCNGSDCDSREMPNSIYGFRIKDLFQEFKRGSRLVCNVCHKIGATIGCAVSKCRSKFHFSCALQRQYSFQYFGSFSSYCRAHRPVQNFIKSGNECKTCHICLEDVPLSCSFNTLCAPCCKGTFFHRKCVQKQALSSGLYFFRCPMCNNKEGYTNEMLRMGIFIPDRDASWETPDAFSELLESPISCDIPTCQCQHGKKYDKPGTVWSISVCVFCSSSGAHVACAMLKSVSSPYVCDICCSVFGQTERRKALRDMGLEAFNSRSIKIGDCEMKVSNSTDHEEDMGNCSKKRKHEAEGTSQLHESENKRCNMDIDIISID